MEFKIKIPLTDKQADSDFQKELVTAIPKMIKNYGNSFRRASDYVNLPIQVLYSFAMVESRGTHNNTNGSVIVTGAERSTGIMQISPNAFFEIYLKEVKADRIDNNLKAVVRKYVNIDFDSIKSNTSANQTQYQQVFNALKIYDFNILAGAIVLRRLLEQSANNDMVMRLDKVIVLYNVGMYSKPTKTPQFKTGDTTALISVVPTITKNYITNIVGKNGAMYYLLKNNIS
jgi:hypothetical protein